jgi:hypothetical protein
MEFKERDVKCYQINGEETLSVINELYHVLIEDGVIDVNNKIYTNAGVLEFIIDISKICNLNFIDVSKLFKTSLIEEIKNEIESIEVFLPYTKDINDKTNMENNINRYKEYLNKIENI